MSSTRLEADGDGRLHAVVTTPAPLEPHGTTYEVIGNSLPSLEPGITFVGVGVGRAPTVEEQVPARGGAVAPLEQRRWSDADRAHARELWEQGLSWQAVASTIGAPKSTVGLWLRR